MLDAFWVILFGIVAIGINVVLVVIFRMIHVRTIRSSGGGGNLQRRTGGNVRVGNGLKEKKQGMITVEDVETRAPEMVFRMRDEEEGGGGGGEEMGKDEVETKEEVTCAVCIDELHVGEAVRKLPCGHEFHSM